MRSRTIDLKSNFKTKYLNEIECSLNGCSGEENQKHIFENCKPILENLGNFKNQNIKYEDIYKSTKKQRKAVDYFNKVMEIREKLLKK